MILLSTADSECDINIYVRYNNIIVLLLFMFIAKLLKNKKFLS